MSSRYIKCIRSLYIVSASYVLMRIVIFLGIVTNVTDLIPVAISTASIHSALGAVIRNAVVLVIATTLYLSCEYVHRIRLLRSQWESVSCISSKYNIVLAIIYLTCFSFLNFLIVVNFICRMLPSVFIVNTVLNIIPVCLIHAMLIRKYFSARTSKVVLILSFIFTSVMVIPYGSIISSMFYVYLL